jgi:hypothetical protein
VNREEGIKGWRGRENEERGYEWKVNREEG